MDFNSLKNTVSNITLYDLKAGVRQLQNGEIAGALLHTTLTVGRSRHELYGDGGQGARGHEQ